MIIPPEITHFDTVPNEFKLLGKVHNPKDNHLFLFLKYKELLVIFSGYVWTNKITGETKFSYYQACFPMAALSWVQKAFNLFLTPPKDGGLPAGKIFTEGMVENERLVLTRGVYVGGDHGGYILENYNRVNYGREADSLSWQRFDFPDPWFFNGGLKEFWEDLAKRYEAGEFDKL